MNNKKGTKRAFLMSLLSLVLCLSMFVGTTFAWFTDEVVSANNIIKSGSLDVEMYWSDNNTDWNDAEEEDKPIFDYKYWEPGYTQVKYVKIKNVGDLAFKFKLNIIPDEVLFGEFKLADVIDVYLFDANATVDRDAIAAATPVGTLSELMADVDGAAHGILLPAEGKGSTNVNEEDAPCGEITYCIVLKMQESAGNDYQNLSVGNGFSIQLLATQYTWEKDSFDHKYDEEAEYDEAPKAEVGKMDDTELDVKTVTLKTIDNQLVPYETKLDTGYVFTAPESGEEAANNPYALWHADFVVTFNRNVTADDCVGLAGQYTEFSTDWYGALANEEALVALAGNVTWVNEQGEIPAGAPIRLLSDIIGVTMHYEGLCSDVQVFKCGAWGEGEFSEPLTMTVELRLYEVPAKGGCEIGGGCNHPGTECETGDYIVIGTYTYTFGN